MSTLLHTQDQLDRAREWVNEHCTDAEGLAYDVLLTSALADIRAIDAANDARDERKGS